MKVKGLNLLERNKIIQGVDNKREIILFGIQDMNKRDQERTKKKFEVAYFVSKEELPIVKYVPLLNLEERHGVDVGIAYRNENTGGVFMDYISDSLADELKTKLEKCHFYSVLTDGSTDTATSENEAVFALHFDSNPPGSEKVKIDVNLVKMVYLKSAEAIGVVQSIEHAFSSIGVENFYQKLVGFGADGASVNRGDKEGVKAIMRRENPWLNFGWCVSHRLELALKDALKGTSFDAVDNLILRLHYLYKKSPKKLRQLQELVDAYEEGDEFEYGGFRPKKASGLLFLKI